MSSFYIWYDVCSFGRLQRHTGDYIKLLDCKNRSFSDIVLWSWSVCEHCFVTTGSTMQNIIERHWHHERHEMLIAHDCIHLVHVIGVKNNFANNLLCSRPNHCTYGGNRQKIIKHFEKSCIVFSWLWWWLPCLGEICYVWCR